MRFSEAVCWMTSDDRASHPLNLRQTPRHCRPYTLLVFRNSVTISDVASHMIVLFWNWLATSWECWSLNIIDRGDSVTVVVFQHCRIIDPKVAWWLDFFLVSPLWWSSVSCFVRLCDVTCTIHGRWFTPKRKDSGRMGREQRVLRGHVNIGSN